MLRKIRCVFIQFFNLSPPTEGCIIAFEIINKGTTMFKLTTLFFTVTLSSASTSLLFSSS